MSGLIRLGLGKNGVGGKTVSYVTLPRLVLSFMHDHYTNWEIIFYHEGFRKQRIQSARKKMTSTSSMLIGFLSDESRKTSCGSLTKLSTFIFHSQFALGK